MDYINSPIFKVVIQPLVPRELPKLLDGLNKINKYYPGVTIKVEESGEHVVLGLGELYLDCLLYDLREVYSQMEIKISNPLTIFKESCANESFAAIPVLSWNDKVSISMGAMPLDHKLVTALSKGKISDDEFNNPRKLSKRLRSEYGWDSLAARNVWTFQKSNVLVDDTLSAETSKAVVDKYKKQIKQGFYWAIREGPLTEENISGVQFKLLNLTIDSTVEGDIGSQLIPLVRKACYVALMTAAPILLEPIYEVDIVIDAVLLPIVDELFQKRRGAKIFRTEKIVGSPLVEVRGQIPVIESLGFEIDLRLTTNGRGMCQLQFWNKIWRKVPGDVLNEEAPIPKLKPAPISSLSRDFVMKTRRRKGISNEGFMSNDGPSLEKYIEPSLFKQLKDNNLV